MIVVVEMASLSQWTANLSNNLPENGDRSAFSSTSWRRDMGDKNKANTNTVFLNGMCVDRDLSLNMQDYKSNKSSEEVHVIDNGTSTVVDSGNIVSVQNNPFFKSFGIRTHRETKSDGVDGLKGMVSNSAKDDNVFDDTEEEQEYHPGSGFVHKLLDKFSSLSAREEKTYRPKRSASLENLLEDHTVKPTQKSSKDDIVTHSPRSYHLSTGSLNVEHVNHRIKPQKPLRVQVAPFKPGVQDTDHEKKKVRSPRNSFEPADVLLGRQDIVIIENTPSSEIEENATILPIADIQVRSVKEDELTADELPKPNTVLNVRSFFESKKSKRAPLPPSPTINSAISFVRPASPKPVIPLSKPVIPSRPSVSQDFNGSISVSDTAKPIIPRQSEHTFNTPRYNAKTVVPVAPYRDETEISENSTPAGSLIFTSKPAVKPRTSQNYDSQPVVVKSQEDTNNSNIINDIKEPVIVSTIPSSSESITFLSNNSLDNYEELKDNTTQEQNDILNNIIDDNITNNEPVKGIPTFLANKRKKDAEKSLGHQQNSVVNRSSQEPEQTIHNLKSQLEDTAASQKLSKFNTTKDSAPEEVNGTSEFANAFRNIENSRSKSQSQGVSMVFDSSQLTVKKRSPISSNVPRLDLSSITNDATLNGHYQEGYKPTEIKPCRIVFIGAMVKLDKSALKKSKNKAKTVVNITFKDNKNSIFEYPSEECLLEEYLVEHPEEKGEMILLPDLHGESNESTEDDFPGTPRDTIALNHMVSDIDDIMKSNTSFSHSGGLSSYRSKYQGDFEFGALLNESEPVKIVPPVQENNDLDSLQMMPAEMDETVNWSSGGTSDLLF